MTADDTRALFVHEDGAWSPTAYSRSPWHDHACHGGPVGALVVHLAERHATTVTEVPTQVSRVTMELPRPVPRQPLTAAVTTVTAGRRVVITAVALTDPSGRTVATARVTHIRADADLPLPTATPAREGRRQPPPPPSSAEVEAMSWMVDRGTGAAFHSHGVRMALVGGSVDDLGPCQVWIRPVVPLTVDTALSPAARAVAVADFVNGVSTALPHAAWLFINPDLDVHLHRHPVGEWVGLDAASWVEPHGVGMAAAALFDERGHIGACVQSLLVDQR